MSSKLRDWDNRHLWHPFTAMSAWVEEGAPIIESGQGFDLFDIEGRRYLDGISSLWCNVHGHCVPELDSAISDQLKKIAHTTLLGGSTPTAIELAHKLTCIAPGKLEHVFFSDAGATAVEAALKMAVQYHVQKPGATQGKTLFVRMDEAYHGDTFGSVSVGRVEAFHKPFANMLFDTLTVPCPVTFRLPEGYDRSSWIEHCFAAVESIIAEHHERIAAFIIEPLVQGAAGILVHEPGYLKHVRKVTAKYDIPLIADEVAVGFGKTGTMFACEQEQVEPDILCLAKGITGGYLPLAATLTTSEIYNAFLGKPQDGKTFYHGHTYTGNALASAVSLANLKLIRDNSVLENVQKISARLQERLQVLNDHPHVGEIRQKGIMTGIELVQDRDSRTPFESARRIGHQVILAARKRGVIIRPLGNVIVLMPAIAMPENRIDELCEVTIASIQETLN